MKNIANSINLCLYQLGRGKADNRVIRNLKKGLKELKQLESEQEFDLMYDSLWKNDVFRNYYLMGNLYPESIVDFTTKFELDFSNNTLLEIRWQAKLFEKLCDKINAFIRGKRIIDECIINGEYKDALGIVEQLEKEFGISLWSLENKIMLRRKIGETSNTEILESAGETYIAGILRFYDMKATDSVEANEYVYLTRREIDNLKRAYPESSQVIDFYNYMIAPFSFEMEEESILNVLLYISKYPLIDRYLCWIDILEHFIANGVSDEIKQVLCMYVDKLKDIEDETIYTFRFMLSDTETRINNFEIKDSLCELKNLYIRGQLEECYLRTKHYIENNEVDINAFNIFIEVCFLLNKDVDDIEVNQQIKNVLRKLSDIYSISDCYGESVEEINKLCFSSIHTRWGRDIYNNTTKYVQPLGTIARDISMKYSNLQKLTIDTVCENLPNEEASIFMRHGKFEAGKTYVEFWTNLLEGKIADAVEICGVDEINNMLLIQGSKKFVDYERLLNGPVSELNRIRISKMLWNNMVETEDIERGIDYFIHLFLKREEYAIIAPISKFITYVKTDSDVDKANIRVPILFYIYATYFDPGTKDELSIACEDFFENNDIVKPSCMPATSESYTREEVIYFLRNICVPQIMGPVLLDIRTSKALDEERINICQYLRNLDPGNSDAYDQEIKDTTHKLFINDRVSTIDNQKVQVNIEGIKSRINKELRSVFNKYLYTRNAQLDSIVEELRRVEGFENLSVLSFNDSKVFDELVTTIRNEFVKGEEYGLDTYLSLNIRHGTLAAQLRAPITKIDLYSEKDVVSGQYIINQRWLYCISDKKDETKIRLAIAQFIEKTDNIIERLRKELIQVSTEEKPTKGIFDYSMSLSEKQYLESFVSASTTFEEFLDICFDRLWQITDENLEKMKSIINDEIKQQYNAAFDELYEAYQNLKKPFHDAERWIREAQNEMDAMLDKICSWFERSNDNQYADFDLEDAFQVGLKTIQNTHPEMNFKVRDYTVNCESKISGQFWKFYYSIFYTLFDNVSKHAAEKENIKYMDCTLESDASRVYIKMQNDFNCDKDCEHAIQRIEQANSITKDTSYLRHANREGGSGIPKIFKIFKVDLRMTVNINCYLNKDEGLFIIEIEGKRV